MQHVRQRHVRRIRLHRVLQLRSRIKFGEWFARVHAVRGGNVRTRRDGIDVHKRIGRQLRCVDEPGVADVVSTRLVFRIDGSDCVPVVHRRHVPE